MSDTNTPASSKRSLLQSVAAKIWLVALLGLPGLVVASLFLGFAGSSAPSKTVSVSGKVRLEHGGRPPDVSLCVMKVGVDGREEVVSRLPLRRGQPDPKQSAAQFHYGAQLELWVSYSRHSDIALDIGKRLHGPNQERNTWHPERYRLRIQSRQPIRTQPEYYDFSQAVKTSGSFPVLENADFVVTVKA